MVCIESESGLNDLIKKNDLILCFYRGAQFSQFFVIAIHIIIAKKNMKMKKLQNYSILFYNTTVTLFQH